MPRKERERAKARKHSGVWLDTALIRQVKRYATVEWMLFLTTPPNALPEAV